VAKNVRRHTLQPGFTANASKHLSHPDEVALSTIRWKDPPSASVLGMSPKNIHCGSADGPHPRSALGVRQVHPTLKQPRTFQPKSLLTPKTVSNMKRITLSPVELSS
jgi:hypothetical protein